jgi:hypothetical protein
MKTTDGKIYPELTRNNLIRNRVGISISFKNKYSNMVFDGNDDGEDFEFVDKLQNTTTNFIITPEIYYNIRH